MQIKEFWQFRNSEVLCSLKETSYDEANAEYMTESDKSVINFDLVKRKYLNELRMSVDNAKSVDALFQVEKSFTDDGIYFVEFKNGNVNSHDIALKARDSLLIFNSITGQQLEFCRDNLHFVLVYNEKEIVLNLKDKLALAKASSAKQDFALFGLGKLRGFGFKSVCACDKQKFAKLLCQLK